MIRPPTKKAHAAPVALSLKLYVAANLPNSVSAIANLRLLCLEACASHAMVEVIDVLKSPERALADSIVVTPMLIRISPEPVIRILGALSDISRVRAALGLPA